MNAHELFHGAVVNWDGQIAEVFLHPSGGLRIRLASSSFGSALITKTEMENLSPLPLSPAVLAGLGFEKFDDHFMVLNSPSKPDHLFADLTGEKIMFTLTHPHSPDTMYLRDFPSTSFFQFVSEYFYGVTLTWNQAAHEAAKTQTQQ